MVESSTTIGIAGQKQWAVVPTTTLKARSTEVRLFYREWKANEMSDPMSVEAGFIEDDRIELALSLLEVAETMAAGGDAYSSELIQEATERINPIESKPVDIGISSEATETIAQAGMLLVSREELGKVVRDIDNDRRILALQRVQALMGPDPV